MSTTTTNIPNQQKKRKTDVESETIVKEEILEIVTFNGETVVSLQVYEENRKKLAESQELIKSLQTDKKTLEEKLSKSEALVKTLQEKDQPIEDDDDDDDSVVDPSNPWAVKFKELREYRAINGDCKVPMKYALNPKLGIWVHNQKLNYANTKMGRNGTKISQDKIDKLDKYWNVVG